MSNSCGTYTNYYTSYYKYNYNGRYYNKPCSCNTTTPRPTYTPTPTYTPAPTYQPTTPTNNTNTNNNNSSATATANVVINQAPATAKTASTVVSSQPAVAPVAPAATTAAISLPETGAEGNLVTGGLGIGSAIVAGAAYVNSRRDLLSALLKR